MNLLSSIPKWFSPARTPAPPSPAATAVDEPAEPATPTPAPARSRPTKTPISPSAVRRARQRATLYTTNLTSTPLNRAHKRARSTSTPPPRYRPSPLVRRDPAQLPEGQEFVPEDERARRETTPRSKRLRRETITPGTVSEHVLFLRDPAPVEPESEPAIKVEPGEEPAAVTAAPAPAVVDEDVLVREAHEAERLAELRDEGFTPQEAQLFLRIRNRGHEPLLPAHWEVDFATAPTKLFFPEHGNQVGHIDSLALRGTFVATKALQELVQLGATVRGRVESRRDPEDRVVDALRKYVQWSVADVRESNYQQYSEIYPRIVVARSGGRGAASCETRLRRKLNELAEEVRAEEALLAQAGVPRDDETASSTLYGIAVSGAVVALLTLDAHIAADEAATPRTMVVLDFSDITLDFWNAISVALLVIAAREDELERHVFYQSHELKMIVPDGGGKKRGWEAKNAEGGKDDDA